MPAAAVSESTDFARILVKVGVSQIKLNTTSQSFNAMSSSAYAHVFNIAVPSLETAISREVLWTCDSTLRIEAPSKAKRRTDGRV